MTTQLELFRKTLGSTIFIGAVAYDLGAVASEGTLAVATLKSHRGTQTAILCPNAQAPGMPGAEVWSLANAYGQPIGDFAVYNGQIICLHGPSGALGRQNYRSSIDQLRAVAERAFRSFSFPNDLAVEGMTSWKAKVGDCAPGSVRFTRIVYARSSIDPTFVEADTSHRIVFNAIVAGSGRLLDTYAIDMQAAQHLDWQAHEADTNTLSAG